MTKLFARASASASVVFLLLLSQPSHAEYDLLIIGGRVIDPETGFDTIASVAVTNGRVVTIDVPLPESPGMAAKQTIDASGMVVAPGFIDLHVHGHSEPARRYQAKDGVTTALELEWGYPDVKAFLDSRRGKSRIHFGAAASHGMLRALAVTTDADKRADLKAQFEQAMASPEPLVGLALAGEAGYKPLLDENRTLLAELIEAEIDAGGIGIGMAHAYYPGATPEEILQVFRIAADLGVTIFTHVSGRGLPGVQSVVANAAATGASLHVVHVNSASLKAIDEVLSLIRGARQHGVDVTTEAYPYTAGSTSIQAALFDGDWRSSYGIDYDGLQWQETGERLTPESFKRYRERGGVVIIHMMKEAWIRKALAEPGVIVASDGMPYAAGAHPRTAGTFSRVLGRYVREQGVLTLTDAVSRMTYLPAQRLEKFVPQMLRKGRLQPGADADIVIFDPATVIDTADFDTGPRFSEGMRWVLVSGQAVVAEGELVEGVFPGEAIEGRSGSLTGIVRE